MALSLDFEPHSYYKGFAIRLNDESQWKWHGYYDDGNSYRVIELKADTLKQLKQNIRDYYKRINERDAYNRAQIEE